MDSVAPVRMRVVVLVWDSSLNVGSNCDRNHLNLQFLVLMHFWYTDMSSCCNSCFRNGRWMHLLVFWSSKWGLGCRPGETYYKRSNRVQRDLEAAAISSKQEELFFLWVQLLLLLTSCLKGGEREAGTLTYSSAGGFTWCHLRRLPASRCEECLSNRPDNLG